MSRKIPPKASLSLTEEELRLRRADKGRLLFTTYKGRRCSLYIKNKRLLSASFFPETPSRIGAVYIGKVKSMAKNIDACFVEIADAELCFLSLKSAAPYLLNRSYDGKLVEGDELLVQVVKDAQKLKKASVTTQIALKSDYFVMTFSETANPEKLKFSLKIGREKRLEIENALSKVPEAKDPLPIDYLVRTRAGELESSQALLEQFFSLREELFKLFHTARYRSCFSCLKEAPADFEAVFQQLPPCVLKREVSIQNDTEIDTEIVTDQISLYESLQTYCMEHGVGAPVRLYQDDRLSLSVLYSVESKLETALANRVWLKSGAYLVIEPTEALTVIDVNSGKCEAGKESEETYRKINLEAAEEVAIQLRLRNLSGIIIVDFINMKSDANNRELLSRLRNLVRGDRIPTQVIDMTPLGLIEITRKKISKPLREQFQLWDNKCPKEQTSSKP